MSIGKQSYLNNTVITIRKVLNGWIVMTDGGGDSYTGGSIDTLVFNDIDSLCDGLKIYYEEEDDNESS
jgi:hypothetical protein